MMNNKHWVALIIVSILSISGSVHADELPIRWTSEIKIINIKEIDSLMNRSVDQHQANGGATLTMNHEEERVDATHCSCKEYLDLKEKGFEPATNMDMAVESWFVSACGPLKYLKNALPSKASYLENFKLSDDPLKNLPLTLRLSLSGDDRDKANDALAKGMTWSKFDPEMESKIIDQNSISLEDQDTKTILTVLAWGDFYHDDIEDILLEVVHYIPGASFHSYGHAVLTRLGKNERLIQVDTKHSPKLSR